MQSPTDDQDKRKQRNDLQREMIMKDSDYKKFLAKKVVLEATIRNLRKDKERIVIETQMKETEIQKIDQECRMMQEEMKSIKKKMNLL